MQQSKLIAVAKISSRGTSLRITLPKEVVEMLAACKGDHLGFYMVNGGVGIGRIGDEIVQIKRKIPASTEIQSNPSPHTQHDD